MWQGAGVRYAAAMTPNVTQVTLAVLFSASVAGTALAQPTSAGLARELSATLAARHVEAVAARDPEAPDAFVAALLYPDVQLLVVRARYPVPAALDPQLAAGQHREVYVALQSNALPDGKLFVQDMQADGLRADADQTADIVYERGVDQTVLNGNPRSREYKEMLAAKDAEYSRVLQLLVDALKASAPPSAGASH